MPGWHTTDGNVELEMIRDDDPSLNPVGLPFFPLVKCVGPGSLDPVITLMNY